MLIKLNVLSSEKLVGLSMHSGFRRRHINSGIEVVTSEHQYLAPSPPEGSSTWGRSPSPSATQAVDEMTCRDRTTEFMSAVRSMQSRQVTYYSHYLLLSLLT